MIPVDSNIQSKTCDNPISSNCVNWAGPSINGVCAGASITDIITSVAENSQCCEGEFPAGNKSCYTGNWVDMSTTMSRSGSSSNCSWAITAVPTYWGNPQYKWTKEGDLKIRGSFRITITPVTNVGTATIPLGTVSTTCFPTGFTESQFAITAVDPLSSTSNVPVVVSGGVEINYSTGVISFGFSFTDIPMTTMTCDISLGGTIFNLA